MRHVLMGVCNVHACVLGGSEDMRAACMGLAGGVHMACVCVCVCVCARARERTRVVGWFWVKEDTERQVHALHEPVQGSRREYRVCNCACVCVLCGGMGIGLGVMEDAERKVHALHEPVDGWGGEK